MKQSQVKIGMQARQQPAAARRHRHRPMLAVLLAAAGLGAAGAFAGQAFNLDWHTLDAGGGTSAGGGFQLAATIGQPDPGPPMSGGGFNLAGGFLPGLGGGGTEPVCPGDLNGDDVVNSTDLNVLLGDFGCLSNCSGDLNGDDQTNSTDLNILLGEFGASC